VLGGGFIGVELADELAKAGRRVTLLEMQDTLLSTILSIPNSER